MALFDKKLWIGSRDKDLYCYDFEKDSLMSVPLTASDEQTIIYSLVPTEAKLYIGSYGGLSFYNPIKKKEKGFLCRSSTKMKWLTLYYGMKGETAFG